MELNILEQTHQLQKKYFALAKKLTDDENLQGKIFVSLLNAYTDGRDLTANLYDGRLQ